MRGYQQYVGLPWRAGGRGWNAPDCVGLVQIVLANEFGVTIEAPGEQDYQDIERAILNGKFLQPGAAFAPGDVLFFEKGGKLVHVGMWLEGDKFLHSIATGSRVDNGLTLISRMGCKYVGKVAARDVQTLCQALAIPTLGGIFALIAAALAVTIALTAVTLTMRPKIPNFANQIGRYANNGQPLITAVSTAMPLPDCLGTVTLAGNSAYHSAIDKSLEVGDQHLQKITRIVIFALGPTNVLQDDMKVNTVMVNNPFWGTDASYTGMQKDPDTAAKAVNGTYPGSGLLWSTYSVYPGFYNTSVPVDIRASYDRNFPVYGFSGCGYVVYRFIDTTKFASGYNTTIKVSGRPFRDFNASGFITGTFLAGLTADGVSTRYFLGKNDVKSISSFTVNGVPFTEIGPGNQTGNVYQFNRTKGFVEFLVAPAPGATISINYSYYSRVWSQNPAVHAIYLMTEKVHGKGIDESKIDWASAAALKDYCDEIVTWNSGTQGTVGQKRFTCNYVLDVRKPVSEHLRTILSACHANLYLSQGRFFFKARKTDASVFSFDDSNILVTGEDRKSSFVSQMIDRSDRANRIQLFFQSQESYNAETGVIRDDRENQKQRAPRLGNDGIVEEILKYPAVDNQSQAERLAETILAEEVNIRWSIQFQTSIKGLGIEPEDLIDVTHSSQPSWNQKLFRVEEISQDSEDRFTIKATEYYEGAYI